MKSKMKKKMIAFLLCMVLVICNSVSILADTPAAETTTTEKQAKETRTAKNEGTSEEEKSSDNSKDTSKSSEETEETKEEAPEMKTTKKKEETTGATTEKKEESTTATTTEKKEETEEASEISEKKETEEAEETATTGSEEETSEAAEETSESEEETTVSADLVYEDDDVKITVGANEKNAIPEGATLKVVPVLKDDDKTTEQYQEVEKKLEEKATNEEYDIAGFLAYDITFVDEGGNKVEPDGEVQVSMEYKESAVPVEIKDDTTDSNVTVMHLEENEEGQVKEVVDMSKNDQLKDVKTTETQKIEKAEFVTDSFSVFTITWIRTGDNGEFDFSKDISMVKRSGNSFVGMSATVGNGELTLTTEDANPVLYTSTISSSGTNNALYSVIENESTYRFSGAYIATLVGNSRYNIAENAKKITKLTGRKNSAGQEVMMYQLSGDISYRNLEEGEYVVFVYSNDALTTTAQCYSQNGIRISSSNVNLTGIGESLDVRDSNGTIPNISGYTYIYTVVGEGDEALEVNYLRYVNEYLQYSLDGTNWSDVNSEPVKFIYKSKGDRNVPGTIETADTRGLIDIDLFNYKNSLDGETTCGLIFGGTGYTQSAAVTQGIVSNNLSTERYPTIKNTTTSLAPLFDGTSSYVDSADYNLNHLFTYDPETGYYSYDSDVNYAYYNTNSNNTERNFVVYNTTRYKGTGKHKIGGFMPYATYNEGGPVTWNSGVYAQYGDDIANKMYLFGMKVSFDFTQPEGGMIQPEGDMIQEDMTFSFSGDDDVWVFIDGKLVLDLGGVHDRASGSINFKTGEVIVNGTHDTSLDEIFNFDGNEVTFSDNSTHYLDFFYLERGRGESNCSLRFNMPPKKSDTIEITKEITNTDREKYANVEFSFKAYLQDEEFKNEDVYEVIPEGTPYQVKKNNVLTGETRYVGEGNIFKLKSGETAVFNDINPDLKYYVEEVDVSSDEFDEVKIQGWKVTYYDDEGHEVDSSNGVVEAGTSYIAKSEEKVVKENAAVKFQNSCADANKNELQITKEMASGQTSSDIFTFLITLENTDGDMVPYEGDYYIIKNVDGVRTYYTFDQNGQLVEAVNEGKAGTTDDGTVSGIPVGYTVVITDLISGTSFDVEEQGFDTGKYESPSISVEENSCDSADTDENNNFIGLGSIKHGKNQPAKVTVTNSKKTKNIYAEKVWNDSSNTAYRSSNIIFGLFTQSGTTKDLINTKTLSSDNDWKCAFEDVVINDDDGRVISYLVREVRKVTASEKDNDNVYELDGNYYQVIDALDDDNYNDSVNQYYDVESSITGDGTEGSPYKITNTLKTFNVNVVKTGSDDQLLAGVEFQLCRDKNGENPLKFTGSSGQYVYSVSGEIDTLVTIDNTGKNDEGEYNPNLTITGLPAGTYYLIETKTVSGHSLLANPVEVILPITNTDEADVDYYYTETVGEETTYYYDVNTFNIKNNQLFTMPEAGGRNIFMLTLAGTAMIALAAGSTIYYRRRRGVHNKTRR